MYDVRRSWTRKQICVCAPPTADVAYTRSQLIKEEPWFATRRLREGTLAHRIHAATYVCLHGRPAVKRARLDDALIVLHEDDFAYAIHGRDDLPPAGVYKELIIRHRGPGTGENEMPVGYILRQLRPTYLYVLVYECTELTIRDLLRIFSDVAAFETIVRVVVILFRSLVIRLERLMPAFMNWPRLLWVQLFVHDSSVSKCTCMPAQCIGPALPGYVPSIDRWWCPPLHAAVDVRVQWTVGAFLMGMYVRIPHIDPAILVDVVRSLQMADCTDMYTCNAPL